MPRSKRPPYYAAPLRSHRDIVAFLMGHQGYRRSHATCSPLAWDVKAPGADLSPSHLIEVYRNSGEYDRREERWLDFPEWRDLALKKYEEVEDGLWGWAIEMARVHVTDDDTNKCLWDGTGLDVSYLFEGRSGGWLLLAKFEGVDLTRLDDEDFHEYLEDLDYRTLRNLCQLTTQNDHDFRRQAVEDAIEWEAAYAWIENCCSDIPRPEKTQAMLALHS